MFTRLILKTLDNIHDRNANGSRSLWKREFFGVLSVEVEDLLAYIFASRVPGTTNGFSVTDKNAWCLSAFWLAWRTSVFNLSAMVFCNCNNEFFFEVNHDGV